MKTLELKFLNLKAQTINTQMLFPRTMVGRPFIPTGLK